MAGMFDTYRHHKTLIFVLIFFSMVLFTVGSMFLGPSTGQSRDPVVATWKFGDIHSSEVYRIQQRNNQYLNFQAAAIANLIQRRPSFTPMTQAQALEQLVLAKKAEQLGIQVSDEQVHEVIKARIEQMTSKELSADMLRESADQAHLSVNQLFSIVRMNLLADNVRSLMYGNIQMEPPGENWDIYLREKRAAKAEIVSLPVESFVERVPDPDESTLKGFYDKYKDVLPHDGAPGFRMPYRASYQYFKADQAEFLRKAEPEINDAQIQDYYDKNRDEFKELELPKDPSPKDKDAKEKDTDKQGTNNAETDLKQPKSKEGEPQTNQKPDAAPKPEVAPKSEDEKKAPATPESTPAAKGESPSKTEEKKPAEPPSTDKGSQREFRSKHPASQLVSFLADGDSPATTDKKEDAAKKEDTTKAEDATKKPDATPAVAPSGEAPKAESAAPAPSTDKKPADEKPADEKTGTDKTGTDKTGTDKTTDGKKDDKPATEDKKESKDKPSDEGKKSLLDIKPTKYKPLEKVKEDIRKKLALEPAGKAAYKALTEATEVVRKYAGELARWRIETVGKSNPGEPPLPPDFSTTAKKYGLHISNTGLRTFAEMSKLNEMRGVYFRRDAQNGIPFAAKVFRTPPPEYRPELAEDLLGNLLMVWMDHEQKEMTPSYEQCKAEVKTAWKQMQAQKLAMQEADRLAAVAKKVASDPLKESLSRESGKKVQEIGPFTWLTVKALSLRPVPELSTIVGVDEPGNEFMRAVFALEEGQIGTAWNQNKSCAYVVRIEKFIPTLTQTVRMFRADMMPGKYTDRDTQIALVRRCMEAVNAEFNLKLEKDFGKSDQEDNGNPASQPVDEED